MYISPHSLLTPHQASWWLLVVPPLALVLRAVSVLIPAPSKDSRNNNPLVEGLGFIYGLYRDNEKENGHYYHPGFRFRGLGVCWVVVDP